MTELFWFAAGTATGVLALMQGQVLHARRARHPMSYDLKRLEPTPPPAPEAFLPTPRLVPPLPTMQVCPSCGRAFKRLAQHQRMAPMCASVRDVS